MKMSKTSSAMVCAALISWVSPSSAQVNENFSSDSLGGLTAHNFDTVTFPGDVVELGPQSASASGSERPRVVVSGIPTTGPFITVEAVCWRCRIVPAVIITASILVI